MIGFLGYITAKTVFLRYILPILIVLLVAAVFAFLLSFLGEKLKVKKDERVDQVREHLAGANCGGCGYAGCDAFAQALVEGKANLSDCNPTAAPHKKAIAQILGIDAGDDEETVSVAHCAGGGKCRNKYDYRGYRDCHTAAMLGGGPKACSTGCMGLGSCAGACEFDAIAFEDNRAKVIVDKCTSCGRCIETCPKAIFTRIPKRADYYCACNNPAKGKAVTEVCEVGCIGCGICAKACPEHAITMENNLPVFDYKKCVSCGKCAEKCPRHIILKHE